MLSRFRRQVRGLAGRIRQLSRGLSVCRPGSLPPAPKFTALPGRRGAPWIGPRSPLFLYLDCPGLEGESIEWLRAVYLAGGD